MFIKKYAYLFTLALSLISPFILHPATNNSQDPNWFYIDLSNEQGICTIKAAFTPLHVAVKQGDLFAVEGLILDKKVNVSSRDLNQETPLHHAVRGDNLAIIATLLEHGADVRAKDSYGNTPFSIASKSGNKRTKQLLENPSSLLQLQPDAFYEKFFKAAQANNTDKVEALLNQGANINFENSYYNTALHIAAEKGNREIVKLLLARKADVNIKNEDERTPLNLAARRGYRNTIEMLVDAGADTTIADYKGWTPLMHFVSLTNSNIIYPPNPEEYSKICRLLIGSHVNAQNSSGDTALHYACKRGTLQAVAALCEHPLIDVNIKNKNGHTPFEIILSDNPALKSAKVTREKIIALLQAPAAIGKITRIDNTRYATV